MGSESDDLHAADALLPVYSLKPPHDVAEPDTVQLERDATPLMRQATAPASAQPTANTAHPTLAPKWYDVICFTLFLFPLLCVSAYGYWDDQVKCKTPRVITLTITTICTTLSIGATAILNMLFRNPRWSAEQNAIYERFLALFALYSSIGISGVALCLGINCEWMPPASDNSMHA